jgi:pilus assembly protein Flp/PilA
MLQLMATLEVMGIKAVESLKERRRDDRGQTAAEYLGIVVVIGAIIGVLATTDIGTALKTAITGAITKVATGNGK